MQNTAVYAPITFEEIVMVMITVEIKLGVLAFYTQENVTPFADHLGEKDIHFREVENQ